MVDLSADARAALATAYVLITMIAGPLLARLPDAPRFVVWTSRVQAKRRARGRAAASGSGT